MMIIMIITIINMACIYSMNETKWHVQGLKWAAECSNPVQTLALSRAKLACGGDGACPSLSWAAAEESPECALTTSESNRVTALYASYDVVDIGVKHQFPFPSFPSFPLSLFRLFSLFFHFCIYPVSCFPDHVMRWRVRDRARP